MFGLACNTLVTVTVTARSTCFVFQPGFQPARARCLETLTPGLSRLLPKTAALCRVDTSQKKPNSQKSFSLVSALRGYLGCTKRLSTFNDTAENVLQGNSQSTAKRV